MKNILVIEPSGNLYGSEMVLLDIITNTDKRKYNYTVVLLPRSAFSELLLKHNINYIAILDINSSFTGCRL